MAKILIGKLRLNLKLINKLWSLDHDLIITNDPKGLSSSLKVKPDLYLIEEDLPHINGLEVCKTIRNESNKPIIITSDLALQDNRELWKVGVDEVIKLPVNDDHLVARVDNIVKRYANNHVQDDCIDYSFIKLFREKRKVVLCHKELTLTPTEYKLLEIFLTNPEKVYSRESLMDMIWNSESILNERSIDIQISRIRKKLGQYSSIIKTVWGMGYKFENN